MSEFGEQERGVGPSCQKKLAPPRSLRNAGMVWDMIAKRYPNAAPLLCEMEVVIERAENLLQQLQSVPYQNEKEIRKSSSTEISGSEEFEEMRSGTDSLSTSEPTNDEVEDVGTGISDDHLALMAETSSSNLSSSAPEVQQNESTKLHREIQIDDSTNTHVAETPKVQKGLQTDESHEASISSSLRVNQDSENSVRMREVTSLEGWSKVVGEKSMGLRESNDRRKFTSGHHNESGSPEPSTVRQIQKVNVSSVKTKTFEEKVTGTIAKREVKANPKTETLHSPIRRAKTASPSSPNRDNARNAGTSSIRNTETQKIKRNAKLKPEKKAVKNEPRKTAMELLTEYAAQNNKLLDFTATTNKTNRWEINCVFAGYHAVSFGSDEFEVKNKVAMDILRMITEVQIDEQNMNDLKPLSDEQMRCIIALDPENRPEHAMRKLYKFCLEKNAPKPIYTVHISSEVEGIQHFAECKALNEVGHGKGIRDETAKKLAAEELYKKLCSERSS